jgi:hypothetical protein
MAKQAFLINPRRRKARKTSRRKSPSRKSVPAWVKSKGFKTWGAYMASIRPGHKKKGGTVAKRRRRRRTTTARPAARRRRRVSYRRNLPAVFAANPRRRRRHSYRRNPPISMNPRGIVKSVTNAGVNAVGVITGKATVRVGRAKIGIAQGTPVGMLTEVGIGVLGGVALKKVSARFAEMFLTGAMVSVLEPLAKGFLPAQVGGALGDESGFISGEDLGDYMLPGQVGAYDVSPNLGDLNVAEA